MTRRLKEELDQLRRIAAIRSVLCDAARATSEGAAARLAEQKTAHAKTLAERDALLDDWRSSRQSSLASPALAQLWLEAVLEGEGKFKRSGTARDRAEEEWSRCAREWHAEREKHDLAARECARARKQLVNWREERNLEAAEDRFMQYGGRR